MTSFIKANWPAPESVTAITTTVACGNIATHVGDDPRAVQNNRNRFKSQFQWRSEPAWLNQTHSTHCIIAENDINRDADAAITRTPGLPLVIMTADCLPVVLCNRTGTEIAAIHAGWRGLCNGIIEHTISSMNSKPEDLIAWIGPAICGSCYEVGDEVRQSFIANQPSHSDSFTATRAGKWMANLPRIAQHVLELSGVSNSTLSHLCTFEEKNRFYSYRRTPETGRIGTFIWLNDQPQDN